MPGIQTEIPKIHRVKLIMAGEQHVGKTALTNVLALGAAEFPRSYNMTTQAEVRVKELPIPKSLDKVELVLVDAPGSGLYSSMLKDSLPSPALLVLVFDITDKASYNKLGVWLDKLQPLTAKGLPCLLLGNKSDLSERRFVASSTAASFAGSNGLLYFETSARDNHNVLEAFRALAMEFHKSLPK